MFCNITQKTTPEENIDRMFHISRLIVPFFLWEGQKHFSRDKYQITFEEGKKWVTGEYKK